MCWPGAQLGAGLLSPWEGGKQVRPEICGGTKPVKGKVHRYLVQLRELDSLLWSAAPSDGGDVQHPVAKLNEGSSVGGQGHKVTGAGREKQTFPEEWLVNEACSLCRDMQEERSQPHSWVLHTRQRPGIYNFV